MNFVRSYLILFVLCGITSADNKLELVQVFFRHGSRTPEKKDIYPNDPYTEKDFHPMGWGQLTNAGKFRAYQLGKLLRDRYDSFFGDVYTPDVAVTLSTDFDRTKMSALLVLAGLFPPHASQEWNSGIKWNPIPYNYYRNKYDYVLRRPTHYCPIYVKELEKVFSSDIAANILKVNRQVLEYIETNTGKPMNTLSDVFSIYQTLNAEEFLNMTLPSWTESVYPSQIHALAAQQCYLENYNEVLKRLNGGRSLREVIENMEAKRKNSTPGRKIYLYSGHENNVINILAALNLFEPHVPKYAAAVIFELHYIEENNSHAVKIYYVRDVNTEPELQILENCDSLCPFDKFLKITDAYVPRNYTLECGSSVNLEMN